MVRSLTTVPPWDLADRLRKSLRYSGVGVQEMAQYLEVTRHTVGNWINGHTRPRAAEIRLWAERCDVPYEWLAHGIDPGRQLPRLDSNQQPAGCGNDPISTAELAGFLRHINIPAAALAAAAPGRRTL